MIAAFVITAAVVATAVWGSIVQTRDRKRILKYLNTCTEAVFGLELVHKGMASRAYVYILLSQLEDEGLVRSYYEPGPYGPRLPRRMYQLTPRGARAAMQENAS